MGKGTIAGLQAKALVFPQTPTSGVEVMLRLIKFTLGVLSIPPPRWNLRLLAFSLFTIYYLLFTSSAFAAIGQMSSEGYQIQLPNLNMTSGRKSGSGKTVTDTVGQIAPGRYDSDGYIVRAGFQYIHSIVPFSFTISDLTIDFGILSPGVPATQSNQLTISTGSAGGFQVSAFEDHPLRLVEGTATILDTTCDNDDCTEIVAKVWILNTVYGFGFNASGDDIPLDFINSTYYRQFANKAGDETARVVMSRTISTYDPPSHTRTATITYKANISGAQEAGRYANAITFIATPKY